MAGPQDPNALSGPRATLVGAAALLPIAGALPWYRLEGNGFVLELSGWNDLGVVAWILAIDLVVWELLRVFGVVRVGPDRGDRWSGAVGGLVVAIGGVFALQRAIDGALGWGWIPGTVLLGLLGWASARTFLDAGGPEAVVLALGAEPDGDAAAPRAATRGDDGPPWRAAVDRPGAPGTEVPPWRARPDDAGRGGPARRDAATPTTGPRPDPARPAPPPAVVTDRPASRRTRRAPGPSGAPAARAPWRSRSAPGDGGQDAPARGWEKTPAERQRDAPSLWVGSREGADRRPGPEHSS